MFALAGVDSLWIYAAFLPMGMVAGMQNPVLASYVNKRIPSERRATMLSVQSVVGSFILGIVQPMGGIMADQFGLQGMFAAFACLTLVGGVGVLLLWSRAETEELNALSRAEERPSERAVEPVPAS